MYQFLSNFKIGTRIVVAFAVLLCILALVSTTTNWTLDFSRSSFNKLREINELSLKMNDIERHTIELQRKVQLYSYTQQKSLAESAKLEMQKLEEKLKPVRELLYSEKDKLYITRILHHLEVYGQTFEEVVKERKVRHELVSSTIVTLRKKIQAFFNVAKTNHFRPFEQAFIEVDESISRYINDPYLPSVTVALKKFRRHKAQNTVPESLNRIFSDYENTIVKITQTTRSYLFLVGVVMAGESQEISYASRSLGDSIKEVARPLSSNLNRSVKNTQKISAVASVFVGVASLFLAFVITRSISFPLTEIAQVLKKLAAGSRSAEIPYLSYKDEVGTIAQAAHVFKQKGEQTEELLAKQKILAAELSRNKIELERSNSELDQFVFTVSHDLKSPIVTSLGFIGMINKLVKNGDQSKALEKIPKIERAVLRMRQLIYDLLDLSRVDRMDFDKKKLDLNKLLSEMIDVTFAVEVKAVNAKVAIQDNLPVIFGNESRILQVFENLTSNALKYAANSPVGARVSIGSKVSDKAEHLLFVKDNGPGINKEYHKKVFALFQRLESSKEGTGVGLAIVQKIVKLHGGRIWIESKGCGNGCTFWMAFPKEEPISSHEEC